MDGVEYVAQRNTTAIRGFPVTTVQCTRKDSPQEEDYHHGRKKWLRLLRICWPAILELVFILVTRGSQLSSKEGILMLAALTVVCVAMCIRNYYLFWNLED